MFVYCRSGRLATPHCQPTHSHVSTTWDYVGTAVAAQAASPARRLFFSQSEMVRTLLLATDRRRDIVAILTASVRL